MPAISIDKQMCRGCELCVDICPVQCLEFDSKENIAKAKETEDCIGCLSCSMICPSTAVQISDIDLSKDFYRDLAIQEKINKFL